MTSYFFGSEKSSVSFFGFEIRDKSFFWAQEKFLMMIPIQDLLEWPHVLKTEDIRLYATFFTRMRQEGTSLGKGVERFAQKAQCYL